MISAVASAQIPKTDGYTMLKSSSSDYLAVYGAKSDSVVVKHLAIWQLLLKLLLTLLCGRLLKLELMLQETSFTASLTKDWCCIVFRCKRC